MRRKLCRISILDGVGGKTVGLFGDQAAGLVQLRRGHQPLDLVLHVDDHVRGTLVLLRHRLNRRLDGAVDDPLELLEDLACRLTHRQVLLDSLLSESDEIGLDDVADVLQAVGGLQELEQLGGLIFGVRRLADLAQVGDDLAV